MQASGVVASEIQANLVEDKQSQQQLKVYIAIYMSAIVCMHAGIHKVPNVLG